MESSGFCAQKEAIASSLRWGASASREKVRERVWEASWRKSLCVVFSKEAER